eukprot:PhM_4_TR7812/c0_g1_i1/m.14769/K14415/RTCB, rtcB; tRNA-splicing ligase RtcB
MLSPSLLRRLSAQSYVTLRSNSRSPTPGSGDTHVKAWTTSVPVEREALRQLIATSELGPEIIYKHIAAMPDVHTGVGCTVGTVIPTHNVIIPSAVGVDIGCGMVACETSLTASDLPSSLAEMRLAIECAVPHGRSHNGRSENDVGGWRGQYPPEVAEAWTKELEPEFKEICCCYPNLERSNNIAHLGTLGTGNHFIEVCLDENSKVWVMLHSGSRGVGNQVGSTFINLARKDMERHHVNLPLEDLAYLKEGAEHYDGYVKAVAWAQRFASVNRRLMLRSVLRAMQATPKVPPFTVAHERAINCHHNYVQREHHFGRDVFVTRKGAISAQKGELGIIPGSMGAKSYIVRGKGNPDSFCSASHGAGRALSRGEAKRRFTLEDHVKATEGVECRKDKGVLDETPGAYKDIDAVMESQSDLVEIVTTLKQIVCVKG